MGKNENYNMLLDKRMRVIGEGPRRQKLPSFKFVGKMPKVFLSDTLKMVQSMGADYNDISNMDNYGLAKCCKLSVGLNGEKVEETFDTKNTRHIMLQEPINHQIELLEKGYTKIISGRDHIVSHIKNFLCAKKEFYRGRVSILHPGTDVPKHIDTNTSVSVRLSFMVQGLQEFFIERRGVIESQIMYPGEIYFINQGWKHWVKNLGTVDRVAILISCDWKELEPYFEFNKLNNKWN